MALRINFNDIPKNELEYRRYLHQLKMSEKEIDVLMQLFRKSITYDNPYETGSKMDDTPGRVIRKPKDKDKLNPFYNILPFGVKDGKISIPTFYNFIVNEDNEPNLELIYNLCMCTKNVHYWFLLTFVQKVDLYNLLMKNKKVRLFGSSNRSKTFGDLFDDLSRFCFYLDSLTIETIRYTNVDEQLQTSEMKQMIMQNMTAISTLNSFVAYLNDIYNFDPIIKESLNEFIPFIWYFVHNNVEFQNINEEDFYINGSPKIKTVSFKEPSI